MARLVKGISKLNAQLAKLKCEAGVIMDNWIIDKEWYDEQTMDYKACDEGIRFLNHLTEVKTFITEITRIYPVDLEN